MEGRCSWWISGSAGLESLIGSVARVGGALALEHAAMFVLGIDEDLEFR